MRESGLRFLRLVLSSLVFNYFFTEPNYSFFVTTAELAYYIAFILFALLIIWFSTVRRGVERELLQSRDELEKEVTVRTQQASLLNLTHDTIFVRDMNDIIASWNRGAQELYGWTAEEAIGKNSHQLLHTVFPVPIGEIQAELLRTGRWEGELEKTKADGTRVVVASRWFLRRNEQESPVAIGGFAGKKFVAPGVVIWTCVGRWSLHNTLLASPRLRFTTFLPPTEARWRIQGVSWGWALLAFGLQSSQRKVIAT